MTYVLVRITVEDLAKWKRVFEEVSALRKKYGSISAQAFSKVENPNELTILGQFTNEKTARELYQSQELRDAMQRAGVKGPPELTFLNEVVKLSA